MLIKKNINHYKNIFWFSSLFIWILSTITDRVWWDLYSNTPSWDQADYLNSALDHARALSFLGGDGSLDFSSLLDKSPKIPPLASIINGAVIAFAGDAPHQAAWSLSFWNGFFPPYLIGFGGICIAILRHGIRLIISIVPLTMPVHSLFWEEMELQTLVLY